MRFLLPEKLLVLVMVKTFSEFRSIKNSNALSLQSAVCAFCRDEGIHGYNFDIANHFYATKTLYVSRHALDEILTRGMTFSKLCWMDLDMFGHFPPEQDSSPTRRVDFFGFCEHQVS